MSSPIIIVAKDFALLMPLRYLILFWDDSGRTQCDRNVAYIYQQGKAFFRVDIQLQLRVLFVITMSIVAWGYNRFRVAQLRG